jgi:hypothetical protein
MTSFMDTVMRQERKRRRDKITYINKARARLRGVPAELPDVRVRPLLQPAVIVPLRPHLYDDGGRYDRLTLVDTMED